MFDDRELELLIEALHILLSDLSEEATFSEIREVELLLTKIEEIMEDEDRYTEDYYEGEYAE